MTRLLTRLAEVARHRYLTIFLLFGTLIALSVALAVRLRFDTDMLKLLPQKDPAIRAYVESLEDFGTSTFLLVAVRIPEGAVIDPYEMIADDLAGRLGELPELASVQHRTGDPAELLETFFPKALLFLDPEGRERLAGKLSDESIRARVAELRRLLGTPQGMALKELVRQDPLGLAEIFLGRVGSSRGTLEVDWTSGYYLSRDHRLLLILAEPKRPPQDVDFVKAMVEKVDAAIAASHAEWDSIAGPEPPPPPEVVLGGPYLTALGDASLIKSDMIINIGTSVGGVLLLFLFAFRRFGALLYAFVPLVSGLLLAFGFAAISVGSLSSATSGVAALLIGLGIDFVIVCYGRYIEERRRGVELLPALVTMSTTSGRAVITGAVTTAATFYAFTFTDFVGLRQMGLLTGTGILLCMAAILLLLPAMLAWHEDHHRRRQTEPNLYIHSFGTGRLMRAAMRHPGISVGAGLAVTLAALGLAFGLRFDESMKTMRPTGNRGMDVAAEVGRHFGSGFDSMTLLLEGDSLEEVLALADRAAQGARRLVAQGVLQGFSGVDSLIPAAERQREALAWLDRQRQQGALDLDRIRATFAAAAAEHGLRTEAFEPGLDLLERAVGLAGQVGVEDFQESEQARLLLERYLLRTDDGWRGAVYLYPPGNRWRREPPPQTVTLADGLGPDATLTGTNVINQRVRAMVLRDAWIAGILGFLLVAIMLWIDFRSLRLTLLSLLPLLVGLVWMLGGMALLDIQMNFINIFVTTMIIGIGVDYGVHVIHRYIEVRDLPNPDVERALEETGGAVVVAALSTIVGFGSMIFSHYPGLRSTGQVAILGAACTCFVAVTLLPAFIAWRRRGHEGLITGEHPEGPAPPSPT